jgi:tetratricopeptide (TPR) repeat protein
MRMLLIFAAFAGSLCAQISAGDALNQGVAAFKSGHYSQAADLFKAALAIDPTFHVARLYLGTAYAQQFVPGTETPENRGYANSAIEQFHAVLEVEPNNVPAAQSLAGIYYNLKDFRNAEQWNQKVVSIDPNNKEAWYTLGVIPWTEFIGPEREARAHEQMKPQDPPPLKDANEREALKAKYWQALTDGIRYENNALAIDPEYENAMAYLNLLIRYRADLDDTVEQAQADVAEADGWVQKALIAQKAQMAARAGQR